MNEIQKRDVITLAAGIVGTVGALEQDKARQPWLLSTETWEILRAIKRDAQKILRKVRT